MLSYSGSHRPRNATSRLYVAARAALFDAAVYTTASVAKAPPKPTPAPILVAALNPGSKATLSASPVLTEPAPEAKLPNSPPVSLLSNPPMPLEELPPPDPSAFAIAAVEPPPLSAATSDAVTPSNPGNERAAAGRRWRR